MYGQFGGLATMFRRGISRRQALGRVSALTLGALAGAGVGECWSAGSLVRSVLAAPLAIPTASKVTPDSGPTVGGVLLTIDGVGFGESGTVWVNGVAAPNGPTSSWSDTQIRATCPPGMGKNVDVVVESGGVRSDPLKFSFRLPVISGIDPPLAAPAGGTAIEIRGSDFGTGGTVTLNGTALPTPPSVWNDDLILANVPAGSGANLHVVVEVGKQLSQSVALSYRPPMVELVEPNALPAGGGPMIIKGKDFGIDVSEVTVLVGTFTCKVESCTDTRLEISVPPGSGSNLPITVRVGGQSFAGPMPVTFSYEAPRLDSMDPVAGPAQGGAAMTLRGRRFGTTGKVWFGTRAVDPTAVQSWTDTEIALRIPPGTGKEVPVTVEAGGGKSNAQTYNYDPPVVSDVDPRFVPAAGGEVIVKGLNFGDGHLMPKVSVGQLSMTVVAVTDTQITGSLPAGSGRNLPLQVVVDGQTSAAGAVTVSYPPVIRSVTPDHAPTSGQIRVTLAGVGFGTTPGVLHLALGTTKGPSVIAPVWLDSSIEFDLPPGVGRDWQVVVEVDGRTSKPAMFSYDAPVIDDITPKLLPAGGGEITIGGSNFGSTDSGGTVTVGGKPLTVTAWSHTEIKGTVAAATGKDLPVEVTVGGQTNAAGSTATLSFLVSPEISSVTSTNVATSGGGTLTINGTGFGASAGVVMLGSSPLQLTGTGWTDTKIVAVIPAGRGKDLPVVVNVNGQRSNTVTFSYGPPVIEAISPSMVPAAGGTQILIKGQNFGASRTDLAVWVGDKPATQITSVTPHTEIGIVVPPGAGANVPVRVVVRGPVGSSDQQSAPSVAARMSYARPTIIGVSPSVLPITGGAVTISGSNFGPSGTLRIGSQMIAPAAIQSWADAKIVATLPAGVGQPLVVESAGQLSDPAPLSYSPPIVSSVTPRTNLSTRGGTVLTIQGQYFGSPLTTPPVVMIGSRPATVSGRTQTSLTVLAPAGTGANLPVVVTLAGQSSQPNASATVSYSISPF